MKTRRTIIDVEGRLQFTFDARWRAFKWDDSSEFKEGLARRAGTQAVDILAAVDDRRLWLIEVKDPRGHRPGFRKKSHQLGDIVADKARDTLAGMLWAADRIQHNRIETFLRIWLPDRSEKVGVALWWEGADAAAVSASITQIEGALAWLKPKVVVTNRKLFHATTANGLLEGITVASLPGAPPLA